eukprot:CAMPEP_0113853692 /NCGR_PEP_ID=MMETSP0372-20130328/6622_1 /TAXON_ID=340204 /ORGANISM="Lankesteria abbotti" /LENGTH=411 /DNA_ID=CAMNT_0000826211 /DNA_START=223 /DNA_END=1458 /DNA_ORIENTATION=+ /assembly_acc=CAM_ASM_000359
MGTLTASGSDECPFDDALDDSCMLFDASEIRTADYDANEDRQVGDCPSPFAAQMEVTPVVFVRDEKSKCEVVDDADGRQRMRNQFMPEMLHTTVMPKALLELSTLSRSEEDFVVGARDPSALTQASWADETVFNLDTGDDMQNEAVHKGGELSVSDIDEKYNLRLRRARIISYVGFAVSLIQGGVSMGFGISHSVVSLAAMGAQICIDLLSSVMVVWRFYTRSGATRCNPRHADAETRFREAVREKRAALGVGVLLTLTSVWAASWAFVKVFGAPPPTDLRVANSRTTLAVAWPGFVLFSIISMLKWNSALKLRSRVLQKDAVCSTFGAALSFITALFATIDYCVSANKYNTGAADSVAALIMAALLMLEGFRTIYQNTVGWVPPSGVDKHTVNDYYTRKPSSSVKHVAQI